MKGDFSNDRFDPARNFTRVLKQQGRVELDSDWNEQAAITAHLLRALAADLIGPAGGPTADCGFGLADAAQEGLDPQVGDFVIGAGRYYVDGILVENRGALSYSAQRDLPGADKLKAGRSYLAYLDVWERHVTALEDERLREVALGGPDTCTRLQTVWQVRTIEAGRPEVDGDRRAEVEAQIEAARRELEALRAQIKAEESASARAKLERQATRLEKKIATLADQIGGGGALPAPAGNGESPCVALLRSLREWSSGTLAARIEPAEPADTPCVLPPDARYRGLENQLYRIEVHQPGVVGDSSDTPSFKWSRENGSVATRFLGIRGSDVQVASARGFAAGQWIEIGDDAGDLLGRPGVLARISRVDGDLLTIEGDPPAPPPGGHPKVRRWDQRATSEVKLAGGAVPITAGVGEQGWIEIESGIEVQFASGAYRSGDYWLITARVATGAIDWPEADGRPQPLPPRGIAHHYAPLFLFDATGESPFVSLTEDCRNQFQPMLPLAR